MTKYFVDPVDGSDENDGRSYETAWKTIAHLNKHDFEAGTTFVLAPETHLSGLELTSSGKVGAPITFRALREEDKQVPMNALLTIETWIPPCTITVRVDLSKHSAGVEIPEGALANTELVHFDVREVEPGKPESIVIS